MAATSNPTTCTHPASTWTTVDGGFPIRDMHHNDKGLSPTSGRAAKQIQICNSCRWQLDERLNYNYDMST